MGTHLHQKKVNINDENQKILEKIDDFQIQVMCLQWLWSTASMHCNQIPFYLISDLSV